MSAILTIIKDGPHKIRFTFEKRQRKPFAGPTQEVWEVPVEQAALMSFCEEMKAAVVQANENLSADPAAFIRAGRGLFAELLPKNNPHVRELLSKLRRIKGPLLISTDEPNLFWELLYDDEPAEFFGLRYRLGRRLMTSEVPIGNFRDRREWNCLLIGDPTGNLPQTARETAQLRDWLGRQAFRTVDYLTGPRAGFSSVLAAVRSKVYDVIHYAGHTVEDKETGEYALELYGGSLFRASLIRKHLQGNPVVFLNGCWSGLAKGLANNPGSVVGLTDAFLAAGAQVVVGSQFQVPDAGARAFAENFYKTLFDGECFGEAMRRARASVRQAPDCAAAWACFVLYGDPGSQLRLREDPLSRLLATAGLQRENFDSAGLRLLQLCLDYSGRSRLVSTAELFAAMVDSPSGLVKSRLNEQQVPVAMLARAFKSALNSMNEKLGAKAGPGEVTFSKNTAAILADACSLAQADGRKRAVETDILAAFVRLKGGNTSQVLKGVGVDVNLLWPVSGKPRPKPVTVGKCDRLPDPKISGGRGDHEENPKESRVRSKESGAMDAADFTPAGWAAVQEAVRLAGQNPDRLLGTPELFMGLQTNREGPLGCALRRLGLQSRIRHQDFIMNGEAARPLLAPVSLGRLKISRNVQKIFELVRHPSSAGAHDRIAEEDLIRAFIRSGGGSVGKMLQQKFALGLGALSNDLFRVPANLFDHDRFAAELQTLLAWADTCVGSLLGRRHFLLFLMAAEKSLLARGSLELGLDLVLARKLRQKLDPPRAVQVGDGLVLSPDLANVLADAQAAAANKSPLRISESLLTLDLLRRSADLVQALPAGLHFETVAMGEIIQRLAPVRGDWEGTS